MTEVTPLDPFSMSPADATRALASMTPPAPMPEKASNPVEANLRLAHLSADPKWRAQVLSGDGPAVKELDQLNALIATGSRVDAALAGVVRDGEITIGGELSTRNLIAGANALRE